MNLLLVDTKLYHTRIDLWLTPKINQEPPEIIVSFDRGTVYQGSLTKSTCFGIDQEISAGKHDLTIEFTNKNGDNHPYPNFITNRHPDGHCLPCCSPGFSSG